MTSKTSLTYTNASWCFLRVLALIYAIAFASLGPQILGLVGSQGILPSSIWLHAVHQQLGARGYWLAPTWCWFSTSDAVLSGLCWSGVALSLLLALDVAPTLIATLLWSLYLSLVTVGQEFLSFQWDNLLLEVGFLTIFLAPRRLRPHLHETTPVVPIMPWLFRWVLFKLMFSSGVVKLASGDPRWRDLTALVYHYETQPLPTWIGWQMHQLPVWWQQLSCGVMFFVELVVPWGLFGPRRIRHLACAAIVGFQVLIALTGNYCFFNLLAVALCLFLLDDAVWPRRWQLTRPYDESTATRRSTRWKSSWLAAPLAGLMVVLSMIQLVGRSDRQAVWPPALIALERAVAPFRTINGYGLFAVMTTTRPEILLEGSDDGQQWRAYMFKYKPGALTRAPMFVAPHQPRLD